MRRRLTDTNSRKQNDETAADFIKNKTHYKTLEVILEEQELEYIPDEGACFAEFSTPIQPGDLLAVTYDGETYETEVMDVQGNVCFGNMALLGGEDDTGEPFAGITMDGMLVIVPADTESASHIVKISIGTYKPLSPEYLPVQTVFLGYPGGTDKYIRKQDGSVATAADIKNAMKYGQITAIVLMEGLGIVQCHTPRMVQYNGKYCELLFSSGVLFTAEYTSET